MPPSFQEDMISKYPALALLTKLGYTYLSPAEALAARDGKTTKVLPSKPSGHWVAASSPYFPYISPENRQK